MTDFPAPEEELLTVTIYDTANTVFIAGITRVFCHSSPFSLSIYYIHGIV